MGHLKKVARTVQVRFPSLIDTKYRLRRASQRILRRPFDNDFRLLQHCRFNPDLIFVDVGANRGEAIDAMRIFDRTRKIVAFEPNGSLAQRLVNEYRHDKAVDIMPFGLGAVEADLELTFPSYNNWDFDALASFKYDFQSLSEGDIIGFDKSKLKMKTVMAKVRRLDSFELAPCFVKIDTEGFEQQVIGGGLETIRKYRPVLLLENGDNRTVLPELQALGYEPFKFGPVLKRGFGHRNTYYIAPDQFGKTVFAPIG
jgi:FkbM family methyltransferase